jgi:DNA-binding NarL/FixJ family response regulator
MNNFTVLIADDSDIVIHRLMQILYEPGFDQQLLKATSYGEAVEVVKMHQPQVVMLDIQLPGKSGIELLKFIRSQYPTTKTIILTNKVNDSYKTLCEKMGADHFIDKSTDFEKIPGIVESYKTVLSN